MHKIFEQKLTYIATNKVMLPGSLLGAKDLVCSVSTISFHPSQSAYEGR